jgi:hypothetical protein
MKKGIIYLMTTAVSGLIKIGKTEEDNFQEIMRSLESNGDRNVVGLKRFFAIKVEDYVKKEKLIQKIFNKHKVGKSELFALDQEIVKQLLLSFKGEVIYPKARKRGELFSFYKKGLKNGDQISFIKDKNIVATVCEERKVEYQGEVLKLSKLTQKIFEQRGELNNSRSYRGAAYFEFNGKKLKDLPDVIK